MATRKRQKWALPFRRGRQNVEDVGYAPFYLQHDTGFSGTKIYRPLEHSSSGGFILRGHYGMTRKDAMAEIKRLAGGSTKQNPGTGNFIKASAVRFNRDGTVTIKTSQKVAGAVPVGRKRNPAYAYGQIFKLHHTTGRNVSYRLLAPMPDGKVLLKGATGPTVYIGKVASGSTLEYAMPYGQSERTMRSDLKKRVADFKKWGS